MKPNLRQRLPTNLQLVIANVKATHDQYGVREARSLARSMVTIHQLRSVLEVSAPYHRRLAVLLLQYLPARSAVKLLTDILETDNSPVIRHEAAFIAGTFKSKASVQLLIRTITRDRSILVKHEAIEALGDALGAKAKPYLSRYLRSRQRLLAATARVVVA